MGSCSRWSRRRRSTSRCSTHRRSHREAVCTHAQRRTSSRRRNGSPGSLAATYQSNSSRPTPTCRCIPSCGQEPSHRRERYALERSRTPRSGWRESADWSPVSAASSRFHRTPRCRRRSPPPTENRRTAPSSALRNRTPWRSRRAPADGERSLVRARRFRPIRTYLHADFRHGHYRRRERRHLSRCRKPSRRRGDCSGHTRAESRSRCRSPTHYSWWPAARAARRHPCRHRATPGRRWRRGRMSTSKAVSCARCRGGARETARFHVYPHLAQ